MAQQQAQAEAANQYMRQKMLFVPRMFQLINEFRPEVGRSFADFYDVGKRDGALKRYVKELIFLSIGVASGSPACLIHVVPAIEAGAKDEEIAEAVLVGVLAAGFLPEGPGLPYALPFAEKVLEVGARCRAGEPWEYIGPEQFKL